jgi:hypothetical protein
MKIIVKGRQKQLINVQDVVLKVINVPLAKLLRLTQMLKRER